MTIKTIAFIAGLAFSTPAFATECAATEGAAGFTAVETPGKTLYTQFSEHPVNEDVEFTRALDGATRAEVTQNLRAFIQKNAVVLNTKRFDRLALLKLLQEKKIRWIGIEASPKEMQTGATIPDLVEEMRKMREDLKIFSLTNQEREDVLSLLYPDYIRLMLDNPQDMRGINIVGIDDDIAKEKSFAALADREKIHERLKALAPARAEAIKKRSDLIMINQAQMPPAEISAFLENDPQGEMRASAEVLFALTNEFVKLAHDRDARAAEVALAQPNSGYLLMGEAHGPGILRRLRQSCSDTGARPAPAPSSAN